MPKIMLNDIEYTSSSDSTYKAQNILYDNENSKLNSTNVNDAIDEVVASTDEINTKLNSKSDSTHTHDDRYYTESEVDSLLGGKSNTNHTHDDRYYTESEIDTKLSGKASTSVATTSANGLMSSTDKTKLNGILGLVYPVGAIYMSVSSTSPATLFGGTWEQIQNRFLLCAGSSYGAGSTGGEASHTLTVNEMPKHKHKPHMWTGIMSAYGNTGKYSITSVSAKNGNFNFYTQDSDLERYTENTGGGAAHNNMPPYLAVYVWKRTA